MKVLKVIAIVFGCVISIVIFALGYVVIADQIDRRAVSKQINNLSNAELLDINGNHDNGITITLKINKTHIVNLGSVTPQAVINSGNIWLTKFGEYTAQEWWCSKTDDDKFEWRGFTEYYSTHEKDSLNGKLTKPIKSVQNLIEKIGEVESAFFSYPVCPQFIETTSRNGNIVRRCIILGDKAIHQGKDWQIKTEKLCQPKKHITSH